MNYTSIEQSKKLLEFGLSPESADMCYLSEESLVPKVIYNGMAFFDSKEERPTNTIPCWSLGALLKLMPPYLFEWERGIDLNIYRNLNGKGWHCSYMPNNINDMQKDKFRQITNGDTPLEAAYNMVVWLLENNYIKKESNH